MFEMNAILLGYVILFAFSAVACLASIPRARKIPHPGTRQGMVVFLVSVALWSIGYVGYLTLPGVQIKLAFYIFGFIFAFIAVGAWLYFCAAYTGRPTWQAPYWNVAISVFVLFILLKITNPLHNLYFTTEWTTEPFPHLAIHHQLLFWVVLGLSYAVIAVGFFMLLERFYLTGSDSRPLLILVGLTAVPGVATIYGQYFSGLLPFMYEPPGVALFAVGTLFVYDQRFEAIRLTGGTNKPTIFLDQDSRIRDYNQPARDIFPALQGSIGKSVESLNSSLADHLTSDGVVNISQDGESRYYEISSAPFSSGDIQTGELVTITDVTDRESYRQRLEEKTEQLEEKTEQLEALNHMVRHDIRNDMAVVLGWAETLQDKVTEGGEDALTRVLGKSRHVIGITENARDFIDSLSGSETIELKSVDLQEILEEELATVRDSYPDADMRFADEIPQVSVQGNELLSSVFRNLLENAIRHNDEETPEITIAFEDLTDRIHVRVADNGPGVPDDQKEGIFGKGDMGLESSGSGIGLYLVHTLTEQFGGDIWVEDNEPKGAVFVVELLKSE